MQRGIIKLLKDDATVAGLIGARIYPIVRPQDAAFPCAVFRKIDGFRDYHHTGPSGLVSSRLQIDTYALDYPLTKQIQSAIIAVLSGFRGDVAGTGWSYYFGGMFLLGRDDENITDGVGGAYKIYETSIDLGIWHTE
jgi:hypothetical protein